MTESISCATASATSPTARDLLSCAVSASIRSRCSLHRRVSANRRALLSASPAWLAIDTSRSICFAEKRRGVSVASESRPHVARPTRIGTKTAARTLNRLTMSPGGAGEAERSSKTVGSSRSIALRRIALLDSGKRMPAGRSSRSLGRTVTRASSSRRINPAISTPKISRSAGFAAPMLPPRRPAAADPIAHGRGDPRASRGRGTCPCGISSRDWPHAGGRQAPIV